MNSSDHLLLAGDIGATKTTLALYDTTRWPGPPLLQQTFRNSLFADFDDLLRLFLGEQATWPAAVCLGVAGPVMADAVRMTNLNWNIAAALLKANFGFRQVTLINDLVATAMGAMHLPAADRLSLNRGEPKAGAVMAVLAPGSGLGEAFLVPHQGVYTPYPSEGGHASFAPRNAEQIELLAFMLRHQAHVSVEQVCSGLAIPELFAFMATKVETSQWLQAELEAADDRTPVIVRAALDAIRGQRPCPVALQTLTLFADILADEAANLALKTLAAGGLFLGGGLAPRLRPFLETERFLTVFARGTYRDWLAGIPIDIILNPETALLGSAACGVLNMSRSPQPMAPLK